MLVALLCPESIIHTHSHCNVNTRHCRPFLQFLDDGCQIKYKLYVIFVTVQLQTLVTLAKVMATNHPNTFLGVQLFCVCTILAIFR